MNAVNHQWMMRGATQSAALRKDWKAIAAVSAASCDSLFLLPPHLLEAVFLCPASVRTIVGVTNACENTDLVHHYYVP